MSLVPQYRAIRSHFYDALAPIDQTLIEIERTKVSHLDAERKFEGLTEAYERLRADHSAMTLDRSALVVMHEELTERAKDLDKAIATAEASASEARAALADRKAKLERTERELEDNKRRLHTVSEQLPSIGRSSPPRRNAFKRSSSSGRCCRIRMLSWRRRIGPCGKGARSSWPAPRNSTGN